MCGQGATFVSTNVRPHRGPWKALNHYTSAQGPARDLENADSGAFANSLLVMSRNLRFKPVLAHCPLPSRKACQF